ncbi:MAG: LAGLIDADG family homing endonuclease [bacterium]
MNNKKTLLKEKEFTYQQVKEETLKYFNNDELAADTWIKKYALKNPNDKYDELTPDDMHRRMAVKFAEKEKYYNQNNKINSDNSYLLSEYGQKRNLLNEEKIFSYFKDFNKIIPQGSVMSVLGNPYVFGSLSNCIVLPKLYDSYGGIMYADQQLTQLFKRRCVEENSYVISKNGILKIKDIKVGDYVLSRNNITGNDEYNKVLNKFISDVKKDDRLIIKLKNGTQIKTSKKHPILVLENNNLKYKNAGELKLNDLLIKPKENEYVEFNNNEKDDKLITDNECDNILQRVEIISIEKDVESENYIDIEVENVNNFYSGNFGFVNIHNCGVGLDLSTLRPEGMKVTNAAKSTSGAVSFMERFSNTTREVGQNSRRGALMLTIDIRHPEVEEFSKIKQDLKKVTGANISLKLRDDFMKAVENDEDYILRFPVDAELKDGIWDTEVKFQKTVKAKELWDAIVECARNTAEPGLIFWTRQHEYSTSSFYPKYENVSTNPCFAGKEKLLTTQGYKTFEELCDTNIDIINSEGNVVESKVWKTGEKETINLYNTQNEVITCTPDHVWKTIDDESVEAKDLKGKQIKPFLIETVDHDELFVKLGFIQGDGSLSRLNSDIHKGFEIHIGNNDEDVLDYFGFVREVESQKTFYTREFFDICKDLEFDPVVLPERLLPKSINKWSKKEKISFLSGLFSANGSLVGNQRISFKSTNKNLILQLQSLLLEFDIDSYYTTNKAKNVTFSNGEYMCKESYDLNIGKYFDLIKFYNTIKFIHTYKNEKLKSIIYQRTPKIRKIEDNGVIDVYDFVEPENHWGVVNGYIAHNCSEIAMGGSDSCRLIAENLYGHVKNPYTKDAEFDYDAFYETTYEAMRLMDDLVDLELDSIERILDKIENDPEPDYIKEVEIKTWKELYKNGKEGRRTGLGFTALGDTIAALGYKFDSDEAIEIIDKIMKTKLKAELDSTIDMAIERGKFNDFDVEIEKQSDFVKMLENEFPEQFARMMEFGRRNISWSTVAPTGSLSILAQTTSGIEPAFMLYYQRRKKINPNDEDSRVDFVDDMGDKWQMFNVMHPKLHTWYNSNYGDNLNISEIEKEKLEELIKTSPYYGSTANEIDWIKRVKIQSIVQKYTTHSISSTINLPNDVTVDKVGEIYMESWKEGLKGITVYRDGARSGVLVSESSKDDTNKIKKNDAPKRPKNLDCDVHQLTVQHQKWVVFVGLLNGDPYEVFALKKKNLNLPKSIEKGKLIKKSKNHYNFETEDGLILDNLNDFFERDEQEALTRIISTALRHGADIKFVVEQLNKSEGNIVGFSKSISRTLKKYLKDGDAPSDKKCPSCEAKDGLIYQEGCLTCKECGYSKCG